VEREIDWIRFFAEKGAPLTNIIGLPSEGEKATEKMSIYLTPTERAKYRKIMREIEDETQKRLDENKFFRLILKHLDSTTLLMEERKG